MQIKNVDNFNLQDCERFLNENPNSDLADSVRLRQRQLMDEIFRANKRDEEARKAQISSCRKKMSWIDVALFNEKRSIKPSQLFEALSLEFFLFVYLLLDR